MPWAGVRGGLGMALGLAAALALCAPSAPAAGRVALVIGNGAYEKVPLLANPGNDARAVGEAFERLGYAVTRLEDAGQAELRQGLQDFKRAASASEVAVVFYAGHGIEVDKRNFLVPVDAKLARDDDVEFEAVPLDLVMRAVGDARRLGLVVLDACRDNPFVGSMQRAGGTRSIGRGLARVAPTGGTLVAYAAEEGKTADDDAGRGHSPYTEALLKHLETPGLEVGRLFRKVRAEVVRKTGGAQKPFEYGALPEVDVFLGPGEPPPEGRETAASTTGGAPSPTPGGAAGQGTGPGGSAQRPERRAAEVVLPDGLTLADWALLAEDRLTAGDHARLLAEAGAHLREYGPVASVEAVRERAVSGLVAEVRVATREDAPGALDRIAQIEAAAGARPELQRLKARAHGLLGDHAAAEAAYLQWLRSVPQTHPDRREVLSALALARARAAHEEARRFTELLGRSFSAQWQEDSAGWTDLHSAALLDLPGAVAALCDAGMDADTRLKSGSPPFGDALKRTLAALGHKQFEGWKADGETPLMMASIGNARNAAAALAACGADVGAKNTDGDWTPLHFAAENNSLDVARLLLDRGAEVEAKTEKGATPLHTAAWKNSHDVAKLLLDRGAEVEAKTENGWTPLHSAASYNSLEVAKLLIDSRAEVNAESRLYITPLHSAAQENSHDVAKLLVERGADGATPLHGAAVDNRFDVAKRLLDQGADVHAKTTYGETPLHFAASYNSLEVAKLLIDSRADVNAETTSPRWFSGLDEYYRCERDTAALRGLEKRF